jgi:hypothetical protein
MKHKGTASRVAALLDENANLRQGWVQSPKVAHIPFMGTQENCFLLVNLHMKPEMNEREKLLNECIAVAQLAIGLVS